MRSSRRRKKGRVYYTNLEITRGRKSKKTIEKLLKEARKYLKKKYQPYIDEAMIKRFTNQIWVDTDVKFKVVERLQNYAEQQRYHAAAKRKEDIYRQFRTDPRTKPVYDKFNSYMYRNGYSARNYWFNNVMLSWEENFVFATCELPALSKGIHYDVLEIDQQLTGGSEFEAYLY